MDAFAQDLKYAARLFGKDKPFLIFVLLTLALGVGASTAVFSLLNTLVYRDLPVRDPSRLVSLYRVNRNGEWRGISLSQIEEIRFHQDVLEGLYGRRYPNNSNVDARGAILPINLGYVTGDYYFVLGVHPLLGRLITPDDVSASSGATSRVAVLSYDFWQRRFNGDRGVVGQTIVIAKTPFTIIGVTPTTFFGEQVGFSLDVTIPITEIPGSTGGTQQALWCQMAVGRLKTGISIEQARAELQAIWPEVRSATVPPGLNPKERDDLLAQQLRVDAYPKNGFSYLRDQFSKPLYVLMGMSITILLIMCVNLATLFLARASARQHEIGTRIALGAGPWRLMRQLLAESMLLSVGAAACGVGLAYWLIGRLVGFWSHIPFNPPTLLQVRVDIRVLGFTAAAALFTGILFGVAPAWYASHLNPGEALQDISRVSGRNVRRFGKLLIIAQVALSLSMLTIGGLLVRSLQTLWEVQPGFDPRHVGTIQLEPVSGRHKNLEDSYYRVLVQQLSRLPGVRSVALSQMLPGSGFGDSDMVGQSGSRSKAEVEADWQIVSPEFFQTMGIQFLEGADFTWRHNAQAPRVALVSKSLADRLFPFGDAIGQHIYLGSEPERQNLEVVGIVSDARLRDIRKPSPFLVYIPFLQEPRSIGQHVNIEILGSGPLGVILEAARQQVEALGRQYVYESATLERVIDTTIANERATAFVAAFFVFVTLLLAGMGVYGLVSYSVTQRTREIGIRMALGARKTAIQKMILRETFTTTFIGLSLGLPCMLIGIRVVRHLLLDLSSDDLGTFAAVGILLTIVALAACHVPARRAAQLDPTTALRHE